MNLLKKMMLWAAMPLALCACGGSEEEETPVSTPITIRSVSVEEGAEVKASELSTITFHYNKMVQETANSNINLNGEKCTTSYGTTRMQLIVNLPTLQDGTSYTLSIPEGSLAGIENEKEINASFTLHFTTKAKVDVSKAEGVTEMLGYGWNLGNHFDSFDGNNAKENYRITWSKTCPYWDNVNPKEDLYKNLAAAGVKTVRLPVTWGPYQDMSNGDYTIDADYMAIVKQNVLWAKAHNLNVILNTHHDEYWQDAYDAGTNPTSNTNIKERLTKTWTQIAEAFKEEGDYLILETFNELNHEWKTPTAKELEIQNEWNQICVDAIRATGGNNATRWIAVPSYQASPGLALKETFVLPKDAAGKLIVAVHCYDPYNFTLAEKLEETWGHKAGNSYDEKNITDLLGKLKNKFIDNNIPCYLGEYGCSIHTTELGEKCRAYYLEYFCRAAHEAGLAVTLWDNNVAKGGSESHGYFNHEDGSWAHASAESLVKTMVKAATSDDASYTLESIYAKAPGK